MLCVSCQVLAPLSHLDRVKLPGFGMDSRVSGSRAIEEPRMGACRGSVSPSGGAPVIMLSSRASPRCVRGALRSPAPQTRNTRSGTVIISVIASVPAGCAGCACPGAFPRGSDLQLRRRELLRLALPATGHLDTIGSDSLLHRSAHTVGAEPTAQRETERPTRPRKRGRAQGPASFHGSLHLQRRLCPGNPGGFCPNASKDSYSAQSVRSTRLL